MTSDKKLLSVSDTIVALATPPFPSAICIVRVSGGLSGEVIRKLFRSRKDPVQNPRVVTRGTLVDTEGRELDDCLAVFYRAPNSYTGEDMAEFFLHGNPALAEKFIEECEKLGLRRAERGEFTLRAFLNGKITLEQAEAVDSLVRSATVEGARLSLKILKGEFKEAVERIRNDVLDVVAGVEASIDFPEDVDPDYPFERMEREVRELAERVRRMLSGWLKSQVLIEGARCVIVGKPNAGKSTLFNRMCGRERAIVTDIPGTTRDFIDARVFVKGVAITFFDTAGIRVTDDPVEREGIKRALELVRDAHCILAVFDASEPPDDDDKEVCAKILQSVGESFVKGIAVLNKTDLGVYEGWDEFLKSNLAGWDVVRVSAKHGDGVEKIQELLVDVFKFTADEVWVITPRQREIVKRMLEGIERALDFLKVRDYLGVSYSLRGVMAQVDELLGRNTAEDIIDRIFSRFCIGK